MRPVVGIICEYDPFHLGHAHQFDLIREQLPDALIICLMSGCFTQRGMPAVHQPRHRAEAAMRAGADLVLELPCAFAVRVRAILMSHMSGRLIGDDLSRPAVDSAEFDDIGISESD